MDTILKQPDSSTRPSSEFETLFPMQVPPKAMAENAIETTRVLVVSRESALLRVLWSIGDSNSWQLENVVSGWDAMERVQSDVSPHALVLDLARGDGDSLHILRWLRRLRPDLPVFVICQADDGGQQREAARLGAEAVVARPFDQQQLESVLCKHLDAPNREMDFPSEHVDPVGDAGSLVSISPVMQKLRAQAELLAQADVPVLILGEDGTGKSTIARLIHKLSVRSGFSFQRVNCATLPANLLEMELFGRSNNSAGGAEIYRISPSKLETANKGALLLGEITEMPPDLQAKLLRVMEERQFVRSGESRAIQANVRVFATSSANLDQALAAKRLREDLYYRLSAFTVHVPPLRKRKEESEILLQFLMHKLARYYGLPPREFTPSVLQYCTKYTWPGNLTELEGFVKRYLFAGEQELWTGAMETVSRRSQSGIQLFAATPEASRQDNENCGFNPEPKSLKSLVNSVKTEAEKNAIAAALDKTRWNRKAAARLLKVSYRSLLYKIDQYHMIAPQVYTSPFFRNEMKGR
ncbi:MAG: sigma-54-dependent transcriptional regulator [Acidobacteriota bacterium]